MTHFCRRASVALLFPLLLAAPLRLAAQDGPAEQAMDEMDQNAQATGPESLNTAQQARVHLSNGKRALAQAEKFDLKAAAAKATIDQTELRGKAKSSFEESIREFQTAVKLDPRLVDGWIGLAELLAKSAHYDQAVAMFDRALAVDKTSTAAMIGKGRAYLAEFKVNEAKAVYDQIAAESAKAAKSYLGDFRTWLDAQRQRLGPDMAQAVAELDSWLAEHEKK